MNGQFHQKNTLSQSLDLSFVHVLKVLALMAAGAFAIYIHVRLKTPLRMPGHHGLEFMSILILTRISSEIKWAASISSVGMGLFLLFPVVSFNDPLLGFNYMLPGIFLDILYNSYRANKKQTYLIAAYAGIAYMSIPLSKLVFAFAFGFPTTTFIKNGFVMPFLTYFAFGSLGGLLGRILNIPIKKFRFH